MIAQDFVEAAAVVLLELTAYAGIVFALDRAAPRQWIRSRHNFALAGLWLLPVVFVLALQPTSSPLFASKAPPTSDAVAPANVASPAVVAVGPKTLRTEPSIKAARRIATPILLVVWALTSIVLALRLGFDAVRLHIAWRRCRSRSVKVELSSPLAVRRSFDVGTPVLIGYGYRTIAVPDNFVVDDHARLLLEHEVAHAVRRDDWSELINRIILVLFWWALPAYFLNRVVRRTREILCDARAADLTGAPRELAQALVDAAARRFHAPALGLAVHPSRAMLTARVQHLVDASRRRSKGTVMKMCIILPAFAAGVFVVTPQVVAQPATSSNSALWVRSIDRSLFSASSVGDLKQMQALIAQGANVNVGLRGDGTPLIAAARNGDLEAVALLLGHGADPNQALRRDGSPLIVASANGHHAVIQRLIQAGAAIDAGVEQDGNPLIAAALRGRLETVEFLLSLGADPNAYIYGDETPLINAAQAGNVPVAAALVKAGADVSLTVKSPYIGKIDHYRSPLSEAQRRGHGQMVKWLKAQGAQHRPAP